MIDLRNPYFCTLYQYMDFTLDKILYRFFIVLVAHHTNSG